MFNATFVQSRLLEIGNTSNVTDIWLYVYLEAMHSNQDIGNWDTSSVTNMSSMFGQCSSFNQDIGVGILQVLLI